MKSGKKKPSVFGVALPLHSNEIPPLFKKLMDYFDGRGEVPRPPDSEKTNWLTHHEGYTAEGLFRVTGNMDAMEKLKKRLEKGNLLSAGAFWSPHASCREEHRPIGREPSCRRRPAETLSKRAP